MAGITQNKQIPDFHCSTPRPNHIFECIKEGLGHFLSSDCHGDSMVFSGESLAHKCPRTGRLAIISFTNPKNLNSIIYG